MGSFGNWKMKNWKLAKSVNVKFKNGKLGKSVYWKMRNLEIGRLKMENWKEISHKIKNEKLEKGIEFGKFENFQFWADSSSGPLRSVQPFYFG